MNIFGQNLGIAQLLIPAICAGALVTANMYFLHISLHRQNKIHISMSIAGLLSLIYVVTHLLALIVGGILLRPDAGVQLYRAEQIFLTFFLFAFPYSITNLLALNEQWQRINKSISLFGLAVACCITVIAFLFPDEFMSTTRKSGVLLNAAAFHGRGQEGVLCAIRDIVFSILILYGAVCFAADLFMKKQIRYIILPMIGFAAASVAALDDAAYFYTGSFTGMLTAIPFSRFSLGTCMFVLLAMLGLNKMRLDSADEMEAAYQKLDSMAGTDPMTRLPNRRTFFQRLHQLMIQVGREDAKGSKAVIIIDIDRFKDINNVFGHQSGDELIRETAKRLRVCLRESDYIFRIGGDKFAVLLNRITEDIDAAVVAQKINDELSAPFVIDGREITINLRIGISIYPKDGTGADALVKSAEMALHAARSQNAIYKFYSDELNVRSQERLAIEKNLRQAIDRDQLSLHYQPMVNIEGRIIGMEALLRWNHPELGSIPPDKFIPIAEATGLIIEIGNWTIETACRQKKLWEDMGYKDLKVSVNLSTKQLLDEDLVSRIKAILDEHRMGTVGLELEITESCIMENPEIAIGKIKDLYDIGICFSIDDFGTGYSSLSYLKRFKIENLKVDKSFIFDIKVDVNNAEITKAIIAMAHSLNLKVIAEGVETVDQFEFLKIHNCDMLQGYLFSRPLPAEEITEMLKRGLYLSAG